MASAVSPPCRSGSAGPCRAQRRPPGGTPAAPAGCSRRPPSRRDTLTVSSARLGDRQTAPEREPACFGQRLPSAPDISTEPSGLTDVPAGVAPLPGIRQAPAPQSHFTRVMLPEGLCLSAGQGSMCPLEGQTGGILYTSCEKAVRHLQTPRSRSQVPCASHPGGHSAPPNPATSKPSPPPSPPPLEPP